MATLTQLENFQTAITAIDPAVTVYPTIDKDYIVLSLVAPTDVFSKYALSDMLTKLAHAHSLHFDGYDEMGQPCFLNEEE